MVMRVAPEDANWKMLIWVRRIVGLALFDFKFLEVSAREAFLCQGEIN